MPVTPLVEQLWFARSEFKRCLSGISAQDAITRLEPMNSISWIIGHLANQENRYWVESAQGITLPQAEGLNDLAGTGKPASTPALQEMHIVWSQVTSAADDYLKALKRDMLPDHLVVGGLPSSESIGTLLYRNIYHYWFHTGEAHAVRQQLGHKNLQQFVGDISSAGYRPD